MAIDLFSEFNQIIRGLQPLDIRYAVCGGFAVAVHGSIRATEDIDFLVHPDDVPRFGEMLKGIGFLMRRDPWTFSDSGLTLHRFLKFEKGEADYYIVDILGANTSGHQRMIERAESKKWSGGFLKVLGKTDLIEMKKKRGSHADLADIEHLEKVKDKNDQD